MAGEKIGKAYEALLKVALDDLGSRKEFSGKVFWNVTPAGISVEPDFILGASPEKPDVVFMVTHSGSSKNSDMKTWRNIGELCEVKTAFNPPPSAINVVFDASMKEGMKDLQAACFDHMLVVEDRPYGATLLDWIKKHSERLPKDQEEKSEVIRRQIHGDKSLARAMRELEADLLLAVQVQHDDLRQLWDMERTRKHGVAPEARNTYVRRGFTKRILVGDALHGASIDCEASSWVTKLRLTKKTLKGCQITDKELLWFLSNHQGIDYKAILSLCASSGFIEQIDKVKNIGLVHVFFQYVISNYEKLTSIEGMLDCLSWQHRNPAQFIVVPPGLTPPHSIWIFDIISAFLKANNSKSQAFGYSSFSSYPGSGRFNVGNMAVGAWCTCFINQYFTRKPNFSVPREVLAYVAEVMSQALKLVPVERIPELQDEIEAQYIAKEYEAVLLAHRGFEPLLGMLVHAGVTPSIDSKISVRTCFAEKAGTWGRTGCTTVARVNGCIINWQSAYQGHPADKTKELCGRAVGLRYTWDQKTESFRKRPGVNRLILLLDGTWTQKHLDALVRAGWDAIYYPDEIDKLKASVLGGTAQPAGHEEEEGDLAEAAETSKPYGRKKGR